MEDFVQLLSPIAPHIAEEIVGAAGHQDTITYVPWPEYDEALTVDDGSGNRHPGERQNRRSR